MRLFLITILALLIYNPQTYSQVCINEFLASNVTNDPDMVDFSDFSDWIELYNRSVTSIDLSGYFLSDNANNLTKWQIPNGAIIQPYGFLRVWADGYDSDIGQTAVRAWDAVDGSPIFFATKAYHTNFKLDRSGEILLLATPDSIIIDSLSYGFQYNDISYGRSSDGAESWMWFHKPTPANINKYGLPHPKASKQKITLTESGFYNGVATVAIDNKNSNSRYTDDGSKPTKESEKYTEPLTIESTSVIRSRIYYEDSLPSTIASGSFFIDENSTLPVVSIITPPNFLFDQSKGIYSKRLKEREIPVALEYFNADRSLAFKMDAGLSLTGQASLYYDQISFTITARERYGADEIGYPLFKQRKLNSFKALYFRNSGVPDHRSTLFRDALQHSLIINKIDVDCQAYQPVLVFINGDYWGIYNIRDKINKAYISSLHQVDPDNIDLLEYESSNIPVVKEGDATNFNELYQFIAQNDLSNDQNYKKAASQIDIDEYISYMICELFYDNMFWPEQNMRMWRERTSNSKWRWILFDTDYGFGMPNQRSTGFTNNTLAYSISTNNAGYKAPAWSTLILRKLLSNTDFRTLFIQYFASYLNTVFQSDTMLATINALQSQLVPEISRHINRWHTGNFYYGYPIQDKTEWENNVWKLKEFAFYRPTYQRQHIIDQFNLGGTYKLFTEISDSTMGYISINNIETIRHNRTGIYFKDVATRLKAVPKPGYRFVKWDGTSSDSLKTIEIDTQNDSITIKAIFEADTVSLLPTHIAADLTITKANSPYYAQGDIIVEANINLTISEGVTIVMPQDANMLVYGGLTVNGTRSEPVRIIPYKYAENWGALCFINSTRSSLVSNLQIRGTTNGPDYTRDKAAISVNNSTVELNNIDVSNSHAPVFAQHAKFAIKNSRLTSQVAGDLINVKHSDSTLVENCILTGNNKYDSDGIDFDNLKSGIIRNNMICNLYGFNSDAIDLGENCQDIIIAGNTISNINDKGISVGGASTVTASRNTIANCSQGAGIKDSNSHGHFIHNTFYSNTIGIACFEKNDGKGGGKATIINSIFANSKLASVWHDNLSEAIATYSLSNIQLLEGESNIFTDPEFINEFKLSPTSPAINTGNPYMPGDPDGSIPDMGANPLDTSAINLIINEIHYNPVEGENYQFIELLNAGFTTVFLDKYELSGAVQYLFPKSSLAAGEMAIIAKDSTIYSSKASLIQQWQTGNLNDSITELYLTNANGELIDFVNYDTAFWWPAECNGDGYSLELFSSKLENMVSQNWRASYDYGGSPGIMNDDSPIEGIFINEFMASNSTILADAFGNYDDWIELYNANTYDVNVAGLYLTDNLNNPLKWQIPLYEPEKTTIPANGYLVFWADGETDEGILHTNYKLDKSGEDIGLVQLSNSMIIFIDSLSFGLQETDISFGKYPDGNHAHYMFLNSTPGLANQKPTSVEMPFVLATTMLQAEPNVVTNTTHINLKTTDENYIKLYICDSYGRVISELYNGHLPAGLHRYKYSFAHLTPGLYFGVAEGEFGRTTVKIIRY